MWTQRISDKTNKEANKVANLRKEMDEKLEKVLSEIKKQNTIRTMQRHQERNTPRAGTSKYIDYEGGKENASEPENQENETQDSPFRPSNMN